MADSPHSAERPARDEIDPELLALRRPRKGVGPVLGLSVLFLTGYLMITLLADLQYALSGKTPLEAVDFAQAPTGRLVTIPALLDHTTTVRLRGKQDTGSRVVAARGTGARLWIQVDGEPANVEPQYQRQYTGRLVRLSDLEYAESIRKYVAEKLPAQPRYVFPESLGKGLPSVDVAGDPLYANADTPVGVDQRIPDHALVTMVASDSVKTQGDAAALLVGAGLIPADAKPLEAGDDAWTWDVTHANGVDAVRAALVERGLQWKTLVEPRIERHKGTWSGLAVAENGVRLNGVEIPTAQIERIAVFSRPTIPDGARVLIEAEQPGRFWYLPPLYGLLAVVAIAMIWATLRGLRSAPPAPAIRDN